MFLQIAELLIAAFFKFNLNFHKEMSSTAKLQKLHGYVPKLFFRTKPFVA